MFLEEEANLHLKAQVKAMDATFFLPDYLMEEAWGQTGELEIEQNQEFLPAHLYTEQVLRILPRELSCKLRMIPAFEETLMKMDEKRGGGDKRGGANKGASSPQAAAAAQASAHL